MPILHVNAVGVPTAAGVPAAAVAGERPGGAQGVGDAQAMPKTETGQPLAEISEESVLPAEQMGAAAHIDPDAVVVRKAVIPVKPFIDIDAGGWAVAHAPVGELFEEEAIAFGIRRRCPDIRDERARMAERHAWGDACSGRSIVDRRHLHGVLDRSDQCQGGGGPILDGCFILRGRRR